VRGVQRITIAAVLMCAFATTAWFAGAATTSKKTTTKSKTSASSRDTVLARVGTEVITPRTVQKRLDEIPEASRGAFVTPEGRQRLLDRLIEERVWYQSAVKHGVPERPEVKAQLEAGRRDLLIRTYVNEVMASKPAPEDSAARAYYDAHLSEYQIPASVAVSHIQLKTESEAKKVLGFLKKGQDWRKLTEQYSADTLTKKNGGSLGAVTKDGMFATLGHQPALAESAFALKEGAIGGPYKSDKGWHILKVEQKREAGVRSFDQMKASILRQMSNQAAQDYYQDQLRKARVELGVKTDSAAIKSFLSMKKTPREMFTEAQAAGAPNARIDAYQRLLDTYPNSDVSPQAQFMIGFIRSEELKDYDGAEKAFKTLLTKYPKSELHTSAQWMIEHMRTEDVPSFMNLESDSAAGGSPATPHAQTTGKP
jgi:peptidyl-prolyl cis-trans isomerase C